MMNQLREQQVVAAHPLADVADQIVARHGVELLRVARRFSACAADADDAFQRALEILLTKAPSNDIARLRPWLMTVVRNEALTIGRERQRVTNHGIRDDLESQTDGGLPPDERVVADERLGQEREALARVKPDQLRCLLLRADGLGYGEICRLTGFSYAKVNRCLSEGRRALDERLENIDSGAECRRLAGKLSMLADGAADANARRELRPHLANCLACQATLRAYRTAPHSAAAALPIGLALDRPAAGLLRGAADTIASLVSSVQERLFGHAATAQTGSELVFAKKAAAVSAIAATLAAGGAVVERVAVPDRDGDRSGRSAPSEQTAEPTFGILPAPVPGDGATDDAERDDEDRRARDATAADVVDPSAAGAATDRAVAPALGGSLGDDERFEQPPEPVDPAPDGDSVGDLAP